MGLLVNQNPFTEHYKRSCCAFLSGRKTYSSVAVKMRKWVICSSFALLIYFFTKCQEAENAFLLVLVGYYDSGV